MAPSASVETCAREERLAAAASAHAWAVMAPQSRASVRTSPSASVPPTAASAQVVRREIPDLKFFTRR